MLSYQQLAKICNLNKGLYQMFVSGAVPNNLVITSESKLEKRILQIISRPKAAGVIKHINLSGVKINELSALLDDKPRKLQSSYRPKLLY